MLKIERNQKKIPAKKGAIETTAILLKTCNKEKNITLTQKINNTIINSSIQQEYQKDKHQ